jgi:hypothetical protein
MRSIVLLFFFLICLTRPAFPLAAEAPVHGLWVWKAPTVLTSAGAAAKLRDFAKTHDINEVYVSVSRRDDLFHDTQLIALIDRLHQAHIRVEALLDSIDADKAGQPRDSFLALARTIVQFNETHPQSHFDGIHLDIEPHQRASPISLSMPTFPTNSSKATSSSARHCSLPWTA